MLKSCNHKHISTSFIDLLKKRNQFLNKVRQMNRFIKKLLFRSVNQLCYTILMSSVRTDNRYVSVSADISVYRPIIGFADMSKPLSVSVIGIGRYRMPYRQPYRYTSRDQIYEEMLHCFTLFCNM